MSFGSFVLSIHRSLFRSLPPPPSHALNQAGLMKWGLLCYSSDSHAASLLRPGPLDSRMWPPPPGLPAVCIPPVAASAATRISDQCQIIIYKRPVTGVLPIPHFTGGLGLEVCGGLFARPRSCWSKVGLLHHSSRYIFPFFSPAPLELLAIVDVQLAA